MKIFIKERELRKKDEREKPLLFKRHKAVRFLISPKKKKEEIEENKIMNLLKNYNSKSKVLEEENQ